MEFDDRVDLAHAWSYVMLLIITAIAFVAFNHSTIITAIAFVAFNHSTIQQTASNITSHIVTS